MFSAIIMTRDFKMSRSVVIYKKINYLFLKQL